MDSNFPWKRYWCLPTDKIHLTDEGYVINPESDFGRAIQTDLCLLASLEKVSCIILLGEPGSGKSIEIEKEALRLKQTGIDTLKIDLRSINSAAELEQCLLQWKEGAASLVLFLDGFDECPIPRTSLCDNLVSLLRRLPTTRMQLRISCRTADLPPSSLLTDRLKEIFPEGVKTYEISPLDLEAVRQAIQISGLNVEETLEKFNNAGVGSLASKPITLVMILRRLTSGKDLPERRTELFEESILALCEERNDGRRANQDMGALDASQRMLIGSRMAAYTLFQRKDAIRTSLKIQDNDNDIYSASMVWGTEKFNGKEFDIQEALIKETIERTSLFTSRGEGRLGWSHQTYPDFLAAWYIHQRNLTTKQIDSLLRYPGSKQIKPRLAECAAWLAGLAPAFLQRLIKDDPGILLRADGGAFSDDDKSQITQALLLALDQRKIRINAPGFRAGYKKLAHEGIAACITPYITDSSHNSVVRRIAIEIAEECVVEEISKALVSVALDKLDDLIVRQRAIHALLALEPDEHRSKLLALLEDADANKDEELKGLAIRALYPMHLSLKQSLDHISDIEDDGVIRLGALSAFFREAEKDLYGTHLIEALKWTETQESYHGLKFSNKSFLEDVLRKGWDNMEDADIATALASAIKVRIQLGDGVWGRSALGLADNMLPAKRMQIVSFLIQKEILEDKNLISLAYGHPSLIEADDLDALLVNLKLAPDNQKRSWATVIRYVVDIHDRNSMDKVMIACKESTDLAIAFASIIGPIELNSPEAIRQKEAYESMQRISEMRPPPEKDEEEPTIQQMLQLPPPETLRKWNNITQILDGDFGGRPEPEIEKSDIWLNLDKATQQVIQDLAMAYIKTYGPSENQLQVSPSIYHVSIFGHLALRLISVTALDRISELTAEHLATWASAMLVAPLNPDDVDRKITKLIYSAAPEAVVKALEFYIHKDRLIERHIGDCWDEDIENVFLNASQSPSVDIAIFTDLLDAIFTHDSPNAFAIALNEVAKMPHSKEHALSAAVAALSYRPIEMWPEMKNLFLKDPDFANDVIKKVSQHRITASEELIQKLPIPARADLYIFLRKRNPTEHDIPADGRYVGLPEFQDALLRSIRDSGEEEALFELDRIEREFPSDEWLPWAKVDAADAVMGKKDYLPTNEELVQLFQSGDTRLIQSGEQLLEVVQESLQRLEKDFQEETPLARLFWERYDNSDRPKDESELSDYVKKHLERDLKHVVIGKREVEVKKKKLNTPKGEANDIQVIVRSGKVGVPPITLVVEVKGDWNEEVMTAMETQLRDRYLLENGYRYGLYLVGWYQSQNRRPKITTEGLATARKMFATQAASLSSPKAIISSCVIDVRIDSTPQAGIERPKRKVQKKPALKTRLKKETPLSKASKPKKTEK